jgi:hypothetical protein
MLGRAQLQGSHGETHEIFEIATSLACVRVTRDREETATAALQQCEMLVWQDVLGGDAAGLVNTDTSPESWWGWRD